MKNCLKLNLKGSKNININFTKRFTSNQDFLLSNEERNLKLQLYQMCLLNTKTYGWTDENLSVSCNSLGLPGVMSNGIYEGVIEVACDLMKDINKKMGKFLENKELNQETIRDALKLYLTELSPYIRNWNQAMYLGLNPVNIKKTLEINLNTVEILSNDFLLKSSLLKTLFICSNIFYKEFFMSTDGSKNFSETYKLLDQLVDISFNINQAQSLIPINLNVLFFLIQKSFSIFLPVNLSKVDEFIINKKI